MKISAPDLINDSKYVTKIEPIKAKNEMIEGTESNVSLPKIDENTLAVSKNQESNKNNGYQNQEESRQPSQETIQRAMENINKNLPEAEAIFDVHDKTKRITIKIIDKKTKEVIKEIPPEKTLDMIAKAWELAGILVDERR